MFFFWVAKIFEFWYVLEITSSLKHFKKRLNLNRLDERKIIIVLSMLFAVFWPSVFEEQYTCKVRSSLGANYSKVKLSEKFLT